MINNVLVIGAHFDDAELGAGGSMKKWSSEGKSVFKMTLTDNVTNFEQYGGIHVDYRKTQSESLLASQILGVIEINDFEPARCNELLYNKDLMQVVEERIYRHNIDTVVIHSSEDANRDHVEASKICLTAARHCPNILLFKSNCYISEEGFVPSFFVNISKYVDDKRRALNCYGGDNNRFGRLFESSIERNHFYGFSVGCEYAEPFKIVRFLD